METRKNCQDWGAVGDERARGIAPPTWGQGVKEEEVPGRQFEKREHVQ